MPMNARTVRSGSRPLMFSVAVGGFGLACAGSDPGPDDDGKMNGTGGWVDPGVGGTIDGAGATTSGGAGSGGSGAGGISTGGAASGGAPSGGTGGVAGDGGTPGTGEVLSPDQILTDNDIDEPGWYKDNIPFIDTPDDAIDEVYYYRWSTYKRNLRYPTASVGYVSTEYNNEIWYSGNEFSYGALSNAAGYHIWDGRWARDRRYVDDYFNFWMTGPGRGNIRNFSEWIISAAYQRSLATGDTSLLEENLSELVDHFNRWNNKFSENILVQGVPTNYDLYWQSPLADATEYTETSMRSSDWFGGGVGYRPTLNSYHYSSALAISAIARLVGDSATADEFEDRAQGLKEGVEATLWDPQREFFMQVYNDHSSNNGLDFTRTTWREAMGFAPWAFGLADDSFSAAWKHLDDPRRFAGARGLTTLERYHDYEAEQGMVENANVHASEGASNGEYVGQIDAANSAVTFTVQAPGAGTFPVDVYYANGSGGTSTHNLVVNGGGSPITVSYPPTGAWGTFSDTQVVRINVPMVAGANSLRFARGTGVGAELDRLGANPYFGYQSYPAVQNHDDTNCCHWNGPSWPYASSQMLKGLANLLQDYAPQSYVTKETYYSLLSQFAELQYRDGIPHVAEAAHPDTGEWVYDAVNFSEHYNHSSFIDLVLTGLLGIRPQADDTLVFQPLVPDDWTYFAVQDLPYHGHLLSIVWDSNGTRYGFGSGLKIYEDGVLIAEAPDLSDAIFPVSPPIIPSEEPRLDNIAANAWLFDQEWLAAWDNRTYTPNYPRAFASFTKETPNGLRCRSNTGPRCTDAFDSPNKAVNGYIRYDVTPDDRWTNVGSPNATDFIGVDFGSDQEISQLSLYIYDDGNDVLAPQSFDVEYLMGDTWMSVPDQMKSPEQPLGNDENAVTFPPVTTSRIRVVFTPEPGAFVGISEIQSWQ